MNKIRVIDLLNKIANDDKAPKKIRIRGFEFIIGGGSSIENYYLLEETGECWLNAIDIRLYDEVEIIEDNQDIKEIPYHYNFGYIDCGDLKREVVEELSKNFNYFATKINEVIKEVNKQKNDEEVL